MPRYKIVFSDIDGTFLDSGHRVLPGTLAAVRSLRRQGIPFVLISARSPSGIRPILEEYGFRFPMAAYSGALLLDEDGKVLYEKGFSRELAKEVVGLVEAEALDCAWNVYSMDTWIVKDRRDPRIVQEENIVRAKAVEGSVDQLPAHSEVGKILCICNPARGLEIERRLRAAFPSLSIARSSDSLVEIMENGVTKSAAVKKLCELWGIPLGCTVAFGDHYNDAEMLETVAMPFLMGNAPEELKKRFPHGTDSNDREGIYHGLAEIGLVPKGLG